MPNYSILVDTRDRLAPQITYVPQENIEVIVNTQVSKEKVLISHGGATWKVVLLLSVSLPLSSTSSSINIIHSKSAGRL